MDRRRTRVDLVERGQGTSVAKVGGSCVVPSDLDSPPSAGARKWIPPLASGHRRSLLSLDPPGIRIGSNCAQSEPDKGLEDRRPAERKRPRPAGRRPWSETDRW